MSVHLELLLSRQEYARVEREEMVAARESIQRLSADAGQADLDEAQDARFRALTREIALLDEEIIERDTEIGVQASFGALNVEEV